MTSRDLLAFVDADVLASPLTRTILMMASFARGSRFSLRWRTRHPNTPEEMHAALAAGHPLLFQAMHSVFPGTEALPSTSEPPSEVFRGSRCLVCGRALSDPESLELGVGPECRRQV